MLLTISLAMKLSLAAGTIKGLVGFLYIRDPDSALQLAGLDFLSNWVPSWALLGHPSGSCWWGDPSRSMPRHASDVLTSHTDPGKWLAHVTGGTVSFWVCLQLPCLKGKAVGMEQPDHPEAFADLIACLSPCQKAPLERGQQENAINILLMKHGKAGVSLVCGVLSGGREHCPHFVSLQDLLTSAAITVPPSSELLPGD